MSLSDTIIDRYFTYIYKQTHSLIFYLLLFSCVSCKCQTKNEVQMGNTLNRLANATSPYLRQHANNPVDWYEWGEEALYKAKKENKPLIISIGYAACHWCHVMAHESFMDSAVAGYMNEHFISIKIDREERPDIDQIYMDAAQLISGTGGWPLNAFALPDGKPFFAGTYYTKNQWLEILRRVNDIYNNRFPDVEKQANALTNGIRSNQFISNSEDTVANFSKGYYESLYSKWTGIIDFDLGGFKRAPKFPLPIGWEFLLQYHYLTGDTNALAAVEKTLIEMAKGGIYDQVGGGFSRYSVDKYWKVPHFEKMLYDNGQLVSLYSHAYQITREIGYADIVKQILGFVKREMINSEGGFYSSLNADSEGEEGKFYVWSKKEVEQVLDPEISKLIIEYYQVTEDGNWENGRNILFSKTSKESFVKKHKISAGELRKVLDAANKKLLVERNRRIRPSTDDKVLTSWNAIMLNGYIDAFSALGEEEFLKIALKNAQFLKKYMIRDDGSLWRSYKNGKSSIDAFLDDYAFLAEAFINLYEVTFDIQWLIISQKIVDYALNHFYDEKNGMFFYTSNKSEKLISRSYEITDNVIPASNSVIANVLYKLGIIFDKQSYISKAHNMLNQVKDKIARGGPYYAKWGMLLGLATYQPNEIAIMGENALEKSLEIQKNYLPTSIFLGGNIENLPLLEHKLVKDTTIIYVCKNKKCKLPAFNVEIALRQIEKGN